MNKSQYDKQLYLELKADPVKYAAYLERRKWKGEMTTYE